MRRTRPDGSKDDIRATLPKGVSERRAKQMDRALTAAIDFNDFRYLDDESRRVCIKLFRKRGWTLPPALLNCAGHQGASEELALLQAIEYTMTDPEVQTLVDPSRYEHSFAHVLAYWGPEYPVTQIKVRHIKEYMLKREKEGAAGSTINKERQALSKMFKVLMQADLIEQNPAQETGPADERPGQRDVYIACEDFIRIVDHCPEWSQPIFETLYLSGMRRGEVLGLTWGKISFDTRIIALEYSETKERRSKRVPIHKALIRLLLEIREVVPPHQDYVFLNPDGSPPHEDSLSRVWRKAVQALGFNPRPTVHDIRHCWVTNATRSGVNPLVVDAIVGHGNKKKSLQSLYLSISDSDLLAAIDAMEFETGRTVIRAKKQD